MYQQNVWKKYDNDKMKDLMDFNEEYKVFLSKGKTERLCVKEAILLAEQSGFRNITEFNHLHPGDKVYVLNKEKNIATFVIGDEPLENGLLILGAHIDSPRLDLKQNPLYESDDLVYLDTHYYGGIIKYQWVTTPLSLVGVVVKKDCTKVEISIGEHPNDPVLGITDLLPHLAQEKMQKTANKVIEGENLDLLIGSLPTQNEEKDACLAIRDE